MTLNHPLKLIPANKRRRLFLVLFFATILLMMLLNIAGKPLATEAAPNGIISYELAGDVRKARQILNSWDNRAQIFAGFNLGLDYLFLVLYATTIGAAILWISEPFSENQYMRRFSLLLAWSLVLAAMMDAIENSALFTMLVDGAASPWPQIALFAALIKFSLVILGLLYVLVVGIIQIYRRLSSK